MSDDNFLSRWSRRKLASKATPEAGANLPAAGVVPAVAGTQSTSAAEPNRPTADVVPEQSGAQSPLPPLDSLTPESDFSPFMKSEVNPATRRAALKTLFQDPHFNVMDGLDVYIDDYSKPDPLPAGWLEKMRQFAALDAHKVLDPRPEPTDDDPARIAQAPEKAEGEQPLGKSPGDAPSHTPDNGSKPAPLGESGSERGT